MMTLIGASLLGQYVQSMALEPGMTKTARSIIKVDEVRKHVRL